MRPVRLLTLAAALLGVGAAALAWLRLGSTVRRTLDEPDAAQRSLELVPVAASGERPPHWGGSEIDGVVMSESGPVAVGGSGVFDAKGNLGAGLPTLRAAAVAEWRGRLVVALAQGGVFRREREAWLEIRSGWGRLHARALVETPAGEILIGARQGLFRAAWGGRILEKLAAQPVRAIALDSGTILAGGEKGLFRVDGRTVVPVETGEPWIEDVAFLGDLAFVVTATGLLQGRLGSALQRVRGGDEVVTGVLHGGRLAALTGAGETLLYFDGAGRLAEERLPFRARRLAVAGGELLADTPEGLLYRTSTGWSLALRKPPSLPPGSAHVTAVARHGEQLVAGLFDGGLVIGVRKGADLEWRPGPRDTVWGVNALLSAGGTLWVASLRGAARFDGRQATSVRGPGAAFALAATADGVAIGYGAGVLLPTERLLSAFQGLPANQATALLGDAELLVGTPSGLGAIRAQRVAWRATSAEGRLPHPWVTALVAADDAVYVGTYGGGVSRRSRDGRFSAFVETEGLKVSAGCLATADGSVWLGSEGAGLLRLRPGASRFERVATWLPSPRVTALFPSAEGLYVGTDEGLLRITP